MIVKKLSAVLLCTVFALKGSAQKIIRNYGFEWFDVGGKLISWLPQNTKGQYLILPSLTGHSGFGSVLITPKPEAPAERGSGLCNTHLAQNMVSGKKTIRVTGFIKTEGLANGVASIWMQLNGIGAIIADKNSDAQSAQGNSDWKKYSIELPISGNVQSVVFGCKMTGTGKAWFDDFEVFIDDAPVQELFTP
ncbi:hypothetical protein LL912_08710 [Niabella sp. CC-SYL272]|uniref:hypothetical protein n=1 Tax=Niabella agricola TaxID=2891571 RepID=UPI001F19675A|nr:hypothetical protein [Niabella agricola]MCF3108856.1 hypothetical protein [Niabella agricola]